MQNLLTINWIHIDLIKNIYQYYIFFLENRFLFAKIYIRNQKILTAMFYFDLFFGL